MSGVPDDVRRLAAERDAARQRRDFVSADALRERIDEAGFAVTDTPAGPEVAPIEPSRAAPARRLRPADVPSLLDRPATHEASVHWLVQGWPQDVERGIASFERHCAAGAVQHVVVDVTGEERDWPSGCDVVALVPGTGWGEARNAGLVRSLGTVVLIADGSVELTGDAVAVLTAALEDSDGRHHRSVRDRHRGPP